MVDRAPTKPNRYAVYDENHNFIRYEYHERADEPTQVGDALNKANLLPDDVASALGLTGNPQVKDALNKLKTLADIGISKAQIATGSYTGTGTFGVSNKNNLALSFVPKVVIVIPPSYARTQSTPIMIWITGLISTFSGTYYSYPVIITSSNTLFSWYADDSAHTQMNTSGAVYNYVAIG